MRLTLLLPLLLKIILYVLWQFYRFCCWSWCRKKPENVPFKDFLRQPFYFVRASAFCPARFFLPLRASLDFFNFYIPQEEPQATYYTLSKSATSTTSRHCPTFTFLLLIFCLYVQASIFLNFGYPGKNCKRLITRSQKVPPRQPRDTARPLLFCCSSFAFTCKPRFF